MHRALAFQKRGHRQLKFLVGVKSARRVRLFSTTRKLAQEVTPPPSSTESAPKKRGFFRTLTLYSAGFVLLFYAASPVIAVNNERYGTFFMESVPFGETITNFMEDRGIDDNLRLTFLSAGKAKLQKVTDSIVKSAGQAPPAPERAEQAKDAVLRKAETVKNTASEETAKPRKTVREKASAAKATVVEKVHETKEKAKGSKERVREVAQTLKTQTEKTASETVKVGTGLISSGPEALAGIVRPNQFSEGVEDLVIQAEAALAGKSTDALPEAIALPAQPAVSSPDSTPKVAEESKLTPPESIVDKSVYAVELPLGFEPPPGYSRPKASKTSSSSPSSSVPESEKKEDGIPLVASVVAEISPSEPVIAELASTIDNLAAFLKDNPSAASSAKSVLNTAQADLKKLAERIDQARLEEREKLEKLLDEQTREYTLKLLEAELVAQDKLDEQEMIFKAFHEDDRRKIIQAFREKLENELKAQSEIINERLRQEVIAQGIELQRRWIRDIKVHVEQERGGRLARLEELATNIKRLERVTLDNAEYLDENLRLHAMWAAIRALTAATIEAPERRPFRDELRMLRHASGAKEDELVSVVLESLEKTDAPDVGIEPISDLTTWFTTSVSPQVARVALVPEHNAGVLSYITSYFLSSLRFSRHGLVEGNDVLSVLSRAEYYLNEKDLDSATRELNQLKGAARALLADWLDAARKRLEVLQAIEVVQAQAKLSSLGLVQTPN